MFSRPFYAYVERGTLRWVGVCAFCCAVPYVWLVVDGYRAFNGFAAGTLVKIAVSAFYFPAALVLSGLLLPHRVRTIFWWTGATLYAAFMLFFSSYFSYFRVFPALAMIGRAAALPAIMGQLVQQVFGLREWCAILCWTFSLYATFVLSHKRVARRVSAAVLVAVCSLCAVHMVYRVRVNLPHTVPEMMKYDLTNAYLFYGFVPPSVRQIASMGAHTVRDAVKPLMPQTAIAPAAAGVRNIVLVQVESLDGWVVDAQADGEDVMPFLRSLRERSLYFDAFYAMHSGGGTTDAELSTYFSMLPLRGGSGFMSVDYARDDRHLVGVLRRAGIGTYVMHPNSDRYFNRRYYVSALKTAGAYFEEAFPPTLGGWHAKDIDFFAVAAERITMLPRPFVAHLITMQSHGPFVNHGACAFRGSGLEHAYLCSMREVDAALRSLFDRLAAGGVLRDTAVLVYGDHESGVRRGERERVPLFVVTPEGDARMIRTPVSQLDLAPTIAAMLGVPASPAWLGCDMRAVAADHRVIFNDGRSLRAEQGKIIEERDATSETAVDYSRAQLRGE